MCASSLLVAVVRSAPRLYDLSAVFGGADGAWRLRPPAWSSSNPAAGSPRMNQRRPTHDEDQALEGFVFASLDCAGCRFATAELTGSFRN